MEEYKLIIDYPNYEVSNHINVRNKRTGRILKGFSNKKGYLNIDLQPKSIQIHRLVAIAFIDNPQNKPQVDHIDNNKINNKVLNLRWCSQSENQHNTQVRSTNICGVKGVRFINKCQKWQARITIDGIRVHIGLFNNMEDAKRARIKKANEIFGEFINHSEKSPTIKLKSTVKLFKTIDDLLNEINQLIHL